MASLSASRVRSAAFLTRCFIFEKASSMGLRSGEYAGRNTRSHPLASMSSLTLAVLCAPSPSSTTCPSRAACGMTELHAKMGHERLLEGPQAQDACRPRSGARQGGGGRDLRHLPCHPQTLVEEQEGGRG